MSVNTFGFAHDDLGKTVSKAVEGHNLNTDNNIIDNPIGLHIALITDDGKMHSLWLPYPPEEKYGFRGYDDSLLSEVLYFGVSDNKWMANCVKPAHFKMPGGRFSYSLELTDRCIYTIEKYSQRYILYAESANEESLVFHNYYVAPNADISIGRLECNDIFYPNRHVSRNHAIIRWENNNWKIVDQQSANGTFVNNLKVTSGNYEIGDCVYILGLRMILGIGFISINDGNGRVHIGSVKIRSIKRTDSSAISEMPHQQHAETKLFNRLPRRRKALDIKPISIEAPPISLNSHTIPLLLRMGSPLVMSSTSLLAGNITAMLSSVLFPVLTQKYSDKQRKEYEERRTQKYNEYLERKEQELKEEILHEERVLNQNYPELAQVLLYADSSSRLWERRKSDDDFLSLRIGKGKLPMIAECDFPDRGFYIDEDPLLEKMYGLVEKPLYIKQVPIMASFVNDNVCGVLGSRNLEIDFVRQLIMQLVLLHSYDEVKIIVLINGEELAQLEFVKYLPHIWSDQRDFRFLAVDTKETSQISEFLQREIGTLVEKPQEIGEILKNRPYYFVFALDKRIFDSMEVLKDVIQSENNCGISVLTVFDDLPKECVKIFDLKDSGEHSVIYLKQIERNDEQFQLDTFDPSIAIHSMSRISNISIKSLSQSYSLPKMISFLEMFNVGKVEQLNPLKRWHENNPVKSLAVPVGVDVDGKLFTLDLHEKYQGPHGLVAGMTGSGKSEFIITYILSMAVNFHPDEVSFILIDYKGGGLAGAFEDKARGIHLPHLAGTITNLDGAAIQRSLMSIQSELMRRQRIFNDAKSLSNEGTMDIYTYQKLYRNGQVAEPLPHLFIISDEFAELKSQEPDFMDQLISAARIGRSLGVHLILATQKPAGVVNDQIWSNTKFRVCLKVQDRGDSFEMLKRPEAAELKNTGRFYLQVGYNEFFAMGQSAWCGATYFPQDTVVVQKDDEIQFVDSVGQPIHKTRPKSEMKDSGLKQIVAIVRYLSELAAKEGIKTHPLWKEPLATCIAVGNIISEYKIEKKEEIEIPLGIIDDPYRQMQYPLYLNFQKCRNYLIVGSSGSGKTTLLQTVLYSLVRDYTPEQINFYILDFSSRNLSVFRKMPHCGTVLMDENEGEIDSLVTLLEDMVEQRKKRFADAEVSSYDAYIKIDALPLILLVIDNLSAMNEFKKGRDLLERITNLMRNGVSYGIKVAATAANLNDCLYRMQHEFGDMIALQANDRYAYSNILNVRCKYEPPKIPGRGMCAVDGEGLEFQTALIIDSDDEQQRSIVLREKLKTFTELYTGRYKAVQIDVAKEKETFEEFCETFANDRFPLGYNLETGSKVAIPLQQLNSVSVYFGNIDGVSLALKNILCSAHFSGMRIIVMHKQKNSLFENENFLDEIDKMRQLVHYKCCKEDINRLNDELITMFIQRTPLRKRICTELGIGEEVECWTKPDALKQWRRCIRTETQSILVLFESMLDFELTVNPEQVGKYKTIFTMSRGYNVYYCGCFYAEDRKILKEAITVPKKDNGSAEGERVIDHVTEEETPEEIRSREIRQAVNTLKECFNLDKFTLLFGGQYDCQNLVELPYEYRTITSPCKAADYNRFLMYYRDRIVRMNMPVGESVADVEEEDEQSII